MSAANIKSQVEAVNASQNSNPRLKSDVESVKTETEFILAQNVFGKLEIERAGLERKLSEKDKDLQAAQRQLEETKRKLQSEKNKVEELEALDSECKKKYGYKETRSQSQADQFYDCVIDIPNLKSLSEGWNIDLNDPKKYDSLKNKPGTIVSVVGNYGKGKTFIFELLSKMCSPHGFSVHTKGISLVYLNDPMNDKNQTPIIGLDTKGGSIPLDISNTFGHKISHEDEHVKMMEIFRDHQATEDLIQNFILEEANVVIVVVADLTFSDQQLVNKIKRKFEKANRKKRIIVVHNLYHTQHVDDVKLKIENFILKSFSLEEKKYVFGVPDKNSVYYEDVTCKDFIIPHVILAKQDSLAGDFYNETSVRYIQSCIQSCGNHKSIDVIQRLYDYVKVCLFSYISNENDNHEFKLEDLSENQKKLIYKGKVVMKPITTNELGILKPLQASFEPNYSISVIHEDSGSKLCLKIECPGEVSNLKTSVKFDSQELYIEVKGFRSNATPEQEIHLVNNSSVGNFYLKTESLLRKEFNIMNPKPQRIIQEGYITLVWPLEEYEEWEEL